jgi:two-component system OmpR family response regulator
MRLLMVDNDARSAGQTSLGLQAIGHQVVSAADGRQALALAVNDHVDAMLLEVRLPFVDGMAVVRKIRAHGIDMPIIMLTMMDDLESRVGGLDAGADDYLIKPTAPEEIDARLRAILRRTARGHDAGVLRAGDIEVNTIKHRALRAGRPLLLQNLEFRLLCELVRHANSVVTREMLYRTVWHYEAPPATNIVESYMRRLRRQLNRPGEHDPIRTIRGVGYMLATHF